MSYRRSLPINVDFMFSVLVSNLPRRTSVYDLSVAFEKCGKVGDVFFPRDRPSGRTRGFAFVRFLEKDDAEDALAMDGYKLRGRELHVSRARYRRPCRPAKAYYNPRYRSRSRSPRSWRTSSRYQSRSDSRSIRRRSRSDSKSTRGRSRSDSKSTRGRSRSDSKSTRGRSRSDSKSTRGRSRSDSKSTRGRSRSDSKSTRGRSRSDSKSTRGRSRSDSKSTRGRSRSDSKSTRGRSSSKDE